MKFEGEDVSKGCIKSEKSCWGLVVLILGIQIYVDDDMIYV